MTQEQALERVKRAAAPYLRLSDGDRAILRELEQDARCTSDCECSDCAEFREREDEFEAEYRRMNAEEAQIALSMQAWEQDQEDRLATPEPELF